MEDGPIQYPEIRKGWMITCWSLAILIWPNILMVRHQAVSLGFNLYTDEMGVACGVFHSIAIAAAAVRAISNPQQGCYIGLLAVVGGLFVAPVIGWLAANLLWPVVVWLFTY